MSSQELWTHAVEQSKRGRGGGGCGGGGGGRGGLRRTSSQQLLADLRRGADLSRWEPELCIQMLSIPASQNYAAICKLLQKAPEQWLVEFLERDGLELLLHSLELQCGQAQRQRSLSVSDALTQAQCVQCIRAAISSDTGLRYIIDRRDYVRQLATALESQNITVKMQVFELLCAMCMYSAKGHAMALDALQHLKVTRAQRYRFDIIMNELRNTENVAYQTRLLSFINCLTLCHNNLQKRVRVRNEFLGLGLGPILRSLRAIDDKELQVQVSAFTNHQHQDEMELESTELLTHHQLFETIFEKIADKPQAVWFYSMLQNLAQLDPSNPNADNVWEALDALSSEAVTPDFSFYKKPPQNTNVSTSLNYKRRVRRCWTINVPRSDDVQETCTVATQTESDDIGEATQPSDLEKQQQLSSAEPAGPPSAPPPPPPPPPPMPSLPPPPPPPPPPMPSLPPPPPPPPPMPSLTLTLTPVIPSDSEVPPPSPLAGPSSVQESKVPPPPPIPSTSGFETPVSRRFTSGYLTYPTRHSLPADLTDSASLWTPLKDKCNTLPMPRRKMRTLNWTKLPSSVIGDTVWTEVQSKAKNLTVDFKQMEELFCQKTANVKRPKSSPGTLPSPVNPKITLLETKRDLAVNIYLKQFKSGGKAVVDAIKNLKGGDIGIEKLRALLPLLPTEKELTSVRAYSGDLDRLGEAEKFYLQLSEVPSFALRIRAMLLKEEFPSRTSELKEQLEAVADASNKLMTNEHLKEFLALVLQLGNYINAGSYAGNAAGFTLSTLPKLLEIKANKPRLTLLHYVVDVAESNNKEILQFTEEMSNMKEIARISLELLQDEVLKVTSDVKHVESQLKKDKSGIRSQFKDFLKSALKCSNELQQAMEKVKASSCALAKHFCEDPQKFQPEECFGLFADFFSVIERVRLENGEKKKEEERRIREREQNRAGGNRSRGRARRISPDRQYAAVERILRDICTGNFKLRRSDA